MTEANITPQTIAIGRAMTMSPSEMVLEFQQAFKAGTGSALPALPSLDAMRLRSELIFEEAKEFKEACANGDLVEAADALGDLLYVILGGFIVFGMNGSVAQEIMARIHVSNMSKLCSSVEEAKSIIANNTDEGVAAYYYKETINGQAILYHAIGTKIDKVVKGPHYAKPDLSFVKAGE